MTFSIDLQAPQSTKEMLFHPKYPKTLQYKEVLTITQEECLADFEPLQTSDFVDWQQSVDSINNGVICTRNANGTGICMGDSGGPVAFNNHLLGLVSWSVGCGNGYPCLSTRIFPQLVWINKTISDIDSYLK